MEMVVMYVLCVFLEIIYFHLSHESKLSFTHPQTC